MMIFRTLFFFTLSVSLVFSISSCSSGSKDDAPKQQKGAGGGAGNRPPVRADGFIVKTKLLLDNIEIPGTIVLPGKLLQQP